MTQPVTSTWFQVVLWRHDHPPILVAAMGEHLGIAVNAAEREFVGSYAVFASSAIGDQVPLGESVGKQRVMPISLAVPANCEAEGVNRSIQLHDTSRKWSRIVRTWAARARGRTSHR